MTAIKIRIDELVKSEEDKRLYRCLELQNGMKVILVSDPTTDKSAAALDVNIGYLSDPLELPGLAHFCEHMLFLGTEKYPCENEYNKFLTNHGGSSNAFTSADHTNFFFDVASDSLFGALDRFAQFFHSPLFTESATDREVNAVNSEHDKNIPNDIWRLNQLEKSTADPSHAFSKFGTGNIETLDTIPKSKGINVREELLKFHKEWYSANIMGLAIVGKETLDDLQTEVVNLFADVENKDVVVPTWTEHPFGPEQLKIRGSVVPVKDIRNLNMTFPIPDLQPYYKSSPGYYLGHLIGHEGPGSLLSELKSRGWVSTLVGGQKCGSKGFAFFVMNVDLTEDGINHVDDIVTLLFQYLNMLKKEGPQKWLFEECRDLNAMQFRFKDKEQPQRYACYLSGQFHDYPIEEVLCGGYLLTEWRPDLINMVLERLTPDNIRVAVIGKVFEGQTNCKEKWYGTEYKQEPVPADTLQKWWDAGLNECLRLPDRNEFIPTNFDLVPREEDPESLPVLLQDTTMSRVWFKQDTEFLLPKAVLNFEFASPVTYLDPLHCNMAYIFVQLFRDALTEYAYAAELSGLTYILVNTKYGMQLKVQGYNDKQHVLLEKILDKMTSFKIDPKRFEILKENYIRGLRNFQAEQPYQHCVYYTNVLLAEHVWRKDELLDATDELTVKRVEAFIPQLLGKLHIDCLIHGNVTKQRAKDLVDLVEKKLASRMQTKSLFSSQLVKDREVQLTDGCHFIYKAENAIHRSSCVETFYQCSLQSTHTNMVLELFAQIIAEPCFNILRTQEQLGYIVFSGVRLSNGVQGLEVLVQSDHNPAYLDSRVEAFLHSMGLYIEEMSDEAFNCHKEALAAKRLEKPKKLIHQTARYWSEILNHQYHFDRDNVEVTYLKTLTKETILKFYNELISHNAPSRHKLAVHVVSTAPGGTISAVRKLEAEDGSQDGRVPTPVCTEGTIVDDVTEFKSSLGLFPLVKSYIVLPSFGNKSKL